MGAGPAWCVEATRNTLRGRRENGEQIGTKEPGLGTGGWRPPGKCMFTFSLRTVCYDLT